jgi:hypothetical integral membrane protein (TIGR02206 family)
VNSYFDTTYPFTSYSAEHFVVLGFFLAFCIWFIPFLRKKERESQRKALLVVAVLLSLLQLIKIPLNIYTGTFDVTKDIPLHLCNFLPFVLIWVYIKQSRMVWGTVFFWIVLGVSQANFTPSVEFSLFHYDAVRYWMVHLGLVLLALYPAIIWGWELKKSDIYRTIIWLNVAAGIVFGLNLLLNSNYMYVMDKPPGTTFFSILPPWPAYILVLEGIIIVWSVMVYGLFRWLKKRPSAEEPFFS